MATALVLGTGWVGSVIGKKLHEWEIFERIHLADLDPTLDQQLHTATKDSRYVDHAVNAMETATLTEFIRSNRIEVTHNACPCLTHPPVLQACADGGSHYIDMAADI